MPLCRKVTTARVMEPVQKELKMTGAQVKEVEAIFQQTHYARSSSRRTARTMTVPRVHRPPAKPS